MGYNESFPAVLCHCSSSPCHHFRPPPWHHWQGTSSGATVGPEQKQDSISGERRWWILKLLWPFLRRARCQRRTTTGTFEALRVAAWAIQDGAWPDKVAPSEPYCASQRKSALVFWACRHIDETAWAVYDKRLILESCSFVRRSLRVRLQD